MLPSYQILASYIYTFISPDGYLAEAHGPGMHFSYTRLGGQKQYELRDIL